jgi:phosphate starvation-inducible PhoH-like protein
LTAEKIFGLKVTRASETPNEDMLYKGYIDYTFKSDDEMAYFYENLNENIIGLAVNEYAFLKSCDGVIVDKVKWTGEEYRTLTYKNFKSSMFGVVKPMDDYQQMAFDSIANNDITILTGKAGSGKTTLPLAYAMQQLENQKFKKLVIVYSFEPLKNAKQLGYIKGDTNTKLLETASIGNILSSKMGDKMIVERMLASGSLEIVPTANIRGVEFNDSIVVLTEAQNLDTYTLKTVIQRCKTGCKLIVEGDVLEQSDIRRESGLFRMIDAFRGYESFGVVKLKNNYRSKICEIADKM